MSLALPGHYSMEVSAARRQPPTPARGAAPVAHVARAVGPLPYRRTMTTTRHYHHVLIGSGQATGTLVAGLPDDESIAVVEGDAVGGTCANTGCTPTKTLVASARVAHLARRAGAYGVRTGEVAVDFEAVMARMQRVRSGGREGLTDYLEKKPNVTLIRGWATFTGPRTVRVGEQLLQGKRVYLNVGVRTALPPIAGLDEVPWLDHARILELERLPEHLVVVGAGSVGIELAQVFARFGAQVTVVEAAERVLAGEDDDVAEGVQELLEAEGVRFRLGAGVERVVRDVDGVRLALTDGGELAASHLLLATGRRPRTDRLELAKAGVEVDERGFVVVDDLTRTSAAGVFALGDANGRGAFTHTSVHDAQVLLDHLRGVRGPVGGRRRADGGAPSNGPRTSGERDPVYALFTDPPVGRVGLTEAEARAEGRRVLVASKPMASFWRAKEAGETDGFVKVLVDADTDRFLGAALFGLHGDEAVGLIALAMSAGLTTAQFRRMVLPHPTVGEMLPFVLEGLQPLD
jgi:pyruvate/2-oxoglutarate dehydrogenase complex dihydrolipoamide dehydrogenase (E3) component